MPATSQVPQLISGTEANPQEVPLSPGQASTRRQLEAQGAIDPKAPAGSPRNPLFERPDTTAEGLRKLPADAVTVRTSGAVIQGPVDPEPSLEETYAEQWQARQDAAMDEDVVELEEEARAEQMAADKDWLRNIAAGATPTGEDMAQGAANTGVLIRDLTRGTVQVGPAAVVGGKKGYNSTIEMIEEIGDNVPFGTITWEGFDGDPNTPARVQLMSGKEAKAQGFTDETRVGKLPKFDPDKIAATEEKIDTVTGNFVKTAAQFGTGWVSGGRILKGWKTATTAGNVVKAMAQGAIADFTAFDGNDARLSNMLNEMAPELRNPITEYLAADDEDPELIGRVKNALEGAGLGVAVDTIFNGIRAVKGSRVLKREARKQAAEQGYTIDPTLKPEEAEAASEALEKEVQKVLKPKKVKATDQGDPNALAKDLADPRPEPNLYDLKLETFRTPDDVQTAFKRMANRNAKDIEAARRGVQSWADTREKAAGLDALELAASRSVGEALNAEQIVALKQLYIGANENLLRVAKELNDAPNSVPHQIAMRRAAATAHGIQLEFFGARAEAGRALQAFQMVNDAGPWRGLDLEVRLKELGGSDGAVEMAKSIMKIAENGGLPARMSTGWDQARAGIRTIYSNGLLSGFATPIVNVLGSSANMVADFGARLAAEGVGNEMERGEALEMLAGYLGTFKEAFRIPKVLRGQESVGEALSAYAMRTKGEQGPIRALAPGLDNLMPAGVARSSREESGKVALTDPKTDKPLGAAAMATTPVGRWLGKSFRLDEASPLGRAMDVLQAVMEAPSSANRLGDDLFAAMSARGSIRASAFRMATREGREAGWTREQINARQAELINSPTPRMIAEAEMHLREMTFSREDGKFEQALQNLRRMMDNATPIPFGTVVAPFLRTPINIVSTAMRYSPLAPFSMRFRNEIAAGGVQRDMALGKISLGLAMYAVFMDMSMNGDLTGGGPGNRAQRQAMEREGINGGVDWQPYSIRIGGRWWSYERIEPLAQNMALVADFSELLANTDWDTASQEELSEVAANLVAASGQAIFQKTTLKGTVDILSAVISGDEIALDRELGMRASSMVPLSSAARMLRRGDDPYVRETHNIITTLKNGLPGMSDDLPMARDLWGKPRTYQSGLGAVYDAIALVKTRTAGANTIDLEILDNGVSVAMPSRTISFDGESVSLKNRPDIYSEIVRQAGEPAFEQLEAVVSGNHEDSPYYYSLTDGPNGGKAAYIKEVIQDYRRAAMERVREEFADDLTKMREDKLKAIERARAGN